MNKDDAKKVPAKSPSGKPTTEDLYAANDPIPVPEVIESDTDTVWGLWDDLSDTAKSTQDQAFAHTVPADLLPEQDGFKSKKTSDS